MDQTLSTFNILERAFRNSSRISKLEFCDLARWAGVFREYIRSSRIMEGGTTESLKLCMFLFVCLLSLFK